MRLYVALPLPSMTIDVFRRLDHLGVLERIAEADRAKTVRERSVRLPLQIDERRRLREGRVRVDAGVVVTADSALCEGVDDLGVRAEVEALAELLTEVHAKRLLVVEVVEDEAAIVLDQSGDEIVRAGIRSATERADRLVVERVLAVQLLLVVVALVLRSTESGGVEAERHHFSTG